MFAVIGPATENERGTKLRDRQKYDDRKHHIDQQLSHIRSPGSEGSLRTARIALYAANRTVNVSAARLSIHNPIELLARLGVVIKDRTRIRAG